MFWPFPTIGHISRAGAADSYPLDLDASLRYCTPKTGIDLFPTQTNYTNFAKIGAVSGFLPQMDARVWAQGYGKDPFGPIASPLPVNLQWQITVPGLNKQMPQY